MIKLRKILVELMNTYSVEAEMLSDRKFNISDILNQVRGLRKVTIVRNITPEDYPQKENVEYTKLSVKFITRGDASVDIIKFKEDIETSDMSHTDLRIPGVKSVRFKKETLKRL